MRFYLRPEPGEAIRGPYSLEEIRQSLRAGAIGPAAQVLEATGQTLGQLRASHAWQEVQALVGALPEEMPTAAHPVGSKDHAESRPRPVAALLVSGILLVWFAGPISELVVPKFGMVGLIAWDPDTVRDFALGTRVVGVLLFVAGQVERVLETVRPSRVP